MINDSIPLKQKKNKNKISKSLFMYKEGMLCQEQQKKKKKTEKKKGKQDKICGRFV